MLRDPVHGDVELTHEELRLVDTAEFQRLRGVKQLGTANLVYVGAVHSRFEHSIGTVEMVERLLDAVDRNAEREPAGCHKVTHEERRILRVAALLHDVTHIPFGHNINNGFRVAAHCFLPPPAGNAGRPRFPGRGRGRKEARHVPDCARCALRAGQANTE